MGPESREIYTRAIDAHIRKIRAEAGPSLRTATRFSVDNPPPSPVVQADIRARIEVFEKIRDFVQRSNPADKVEPGVVVGLEEPEDDDSGATGRTSLHIVAPPGLEIRIVPGIPGFISADSELGRNIMGLRAGDEKTYEVRRRGETIRRYSVRIVSVE